jgi:hypothetical protein
MVVALLALVLAAAGGAYAAIPDTPGGTIHVCYDPADANRDASGAKLGIIDKARNPRGCDSDDVELTLNQKGPKGDACLPSNPLCVGPKGDKGDAATSVAYSGFAYSKTITGLLETPVLSKDVPTGTYTVNAKVLMHNGTNATADVNCVLRMGDEYLDQTQTTLLPTGDAGVPLQGVTTGSFAGPITVGCSAPATGTTFQANATVVTATPFSSIQ